MYAHSRLIVLKTAWENMTLSFIFQGLRSSCHKEGWWHCSPGSLLSCKRRVSIQALSPGA